MKSKDSSRFALGAIAIAASTFALLVPQAASAGGAPLAGAALQGAAASGEAAGTDRLIIKYRSSVAAAQASAGASAHAALHRAAQDAAARHGLNLKLVRVGALDTHVMRLDRHLPHAEMQRLAREIAASDTSVEYAEPDRVLQPMATPNDTQYGQQWHYYEATGGLNLPPAWDKSTGSGVTVAVIDTGYRPHVDLAANIVAGYDFIIDTAVSNDGNARDSNPQDPGDAVAAGECGTGSAASNSSWHGTHVAGTIAAVTNNGSGVAGVAFNAKVQPLRVLGKCGGYTSDIADAMVWASGGTISGIPANATPARVINMSLGGSGACDTTSQNAINSARSRGTVVVVAAGNSNANAANFSPASCTGVITVAATDRNGGKSYYSNFGANVAVAAPGGDMRGSAANGILSTLNNGATGPGSDIYAYYQGTSMATPHVAGVVALMLSKNPALTPDQVATALKGSTRPFPGTCSQCGTGIVDASAAVDAAGGSAPPPAGNEVEPNNSTSAPQAVTIPITINGTIASTTDTDYFKVSLGAGKKLTATLTPNSTSDYDLYIYNAGGTQVASSIKSTGQIDSTSVTNTGTAAATYYVRVRYYGGGTGATSGKYTLGMN